MRKCRGIAVVAGLVMFVAIGRGGLCHAAEAPVPSLVAMVSEVMGIKGDADVSGLLPEAFIEARAGRLDAPAVRKLVETINRGANMDLIESKYADALGVNDHFRSQTAEGEPKLGMVMWMDVWKLARSLWEGGRQRLEHDRAGGVADVRAALILGATDEWWAHSMAFVVMVRNAEECRRAADLTQEQMTALTSAMEKNKAYHQPFIWKCFYPLALADAKIIQGAGTGALPEDLVTAVLSAAEKCLAQADGRPARLWRIANGVWRSKCLAENNKDQAAMERINQWALMRAKEQTNANARRWFEEIPRTSGPRPDTMLTGDEGDK